MGLFSLFRKKKEVEVPVAEPIKQEAAPVAPEATPAPAEAPVAEAPVAEAPASKEETPAAPKAEEKPAVQAKPFSQTKPFSAAAPKADVKPATPKAEEKPVEKAAPTVKPAPVAPKATPAPMKAAAPAPKPEPVSEPRVMGKFDFDLASDGYRFYLLANNGQLLYESIGFTTLEGALVGIDTFRRAVAGGNFVVLADKYDHYRFVLNRKYYGENYSTRKQCESAVESVKRFAEDSVIAEYTPTEEKLARFAEAKAARRTPADIDWDAVAAKEAATPRLGKFEIIRGEDREFRFYLVANNGQVLYTGKNYEKLCQCQAGIKSFKRAVYVGNFTVDEDKFGRFRYILRNIGVAPAFMGESYTTRKQCESSIESVKSFVVSAEIVLPETAEADA